jgi:hypothetical protein
LGLVDANGIPQTATFTDENNGAVTVTITKGAQLTDVYVLLAYSYDGGSGIATLNLSTGGLADVLQAPDNWSLIYASGTSSWYASSGGLYRMNLVDGADSLISTGTPAWDTNAFGGPATQGATTAWGSTTWVYADAAGNAYAINCTNSQNFQAAAVTAAGAQVDFGNNSVAWTFFNSLPGTSLKYQSWTAVNPSTGAVFLVKGTDHGAGVRDVSVFPVTFNPTSPGVLSISDTAVSGPVSSDVSYMTHVGFGSSLTSSIWSTGANTWTVTDVGSLTAYNTSAVPVSTELNGSDYGIGAVTNWIYSGSEVYAGPNGSQNTISMVQLEGGGSVANPVLLTDPGITSWTIVGGVLFYTNTSGTFAATVNTAAGTISTPEPYEGGPVQGITQ